jgi:hypothetical protein
MSHRGQGTKKWFAFLLFLFCRLVHAVGNETVEVINSRIVSRRMLLVVKVIRALRLSTVTEDRS